MNTDTVEPARAGESIESALALLRVGRAADAAQICRRLLAARPQDFNALHLLGLAHHQLGEHAAAVSYLRQAIAVHATSAFPYTNLAAALLALGRAGEALTCCERALALQPDWLDAHTNRGHALRMQGRLEEALACYERAGEMAPSARDPQLARVAVLLQLRRDAEALHAADAAIERFPRHAPLLTSRGHALLKLERPEEALAAFDLALVLAPDSAEIWNNRGSAQRRLRRPSDAAASFERALQLQPQMAEAWCNRANLAMDASHYEEAVRLCDQALQVRTGLAEAWHIRGTALRAAGRCADAAEAFARLVTLAPGFDYALGDLYFVRARICDWKDREARAARIIAGVERGERVVSPHAFLSISDSPRTQRQCARTFVADHLGTPEPVWRGERYGHERLRIAYLSADYHDHPVSHLIAGVIERHDRERFEVHGFSLRRDSTPDPMRLRMQRAFDRFHDVAESSDRDVALLLRALEIDVAIDLTGLARGARLGILSHRPAPIQVGYLGFAGTYGCEHIDFLVADEYVVPEEQAPWYDEHLVRLPHSFLPNDDTQPIAEEVPTRAELGLPERAFVFCALHISYKIDPATFGVWMRLLRETPGSVLWLAAGEAATRENLLREAQAQGVAAHRLVFAPKLARLDQHLARHRRADLFLDTRPYGGHTTARDALWAGLPVLTCVGDSFASRVGGSLLRQLDLHELITTNLEDYARRALLLAHAPHALLELRARLAEKRRTSPVFDTDLCRRHLETAYDTLTRRHERGEPRRSLRVPPAERS